MNISIEEKQYVLDQQTKTYVLEPDAEVEAKFVLNGLKALTFVGDTGTLTDKSSQSDVAAHIELVCLKKLREEIDNDPMGLGYMGKTDAEIADLINKPFVRQISTMKLLPSRANVIYAQSVAEALYSQLVTAVDVAFAKALPPEKVGDPAALALAKLQDEIAKDPAGRGYASKTDQEIADLLNATYSASVTVDERGNQRVTVIWADIPYAPNVVSEDDVGAANGI